MDVWDFALTNEFVENPIDFTVKDEKTKSQSIIELFHNK